MQLIGSPEAIENYLAANPTAASEAARSIFTNDEALLAFELGEARYPAPVEEILDAWLKQRNAAEDRA